MTLLFAALLVPAMLASQVAPDDERLALESLRQVARVSRAQGRFQEAERALTQAIPLAVMIEGDTSLALAPLLSQLSGAQRALGKRKEALLSIASAIQIRDQYPAEQLPELSDDLLSAASLRIELGDSSAAKNLLTRALAVWDKLLQPDSPQALRTLDTLA